MRYIITLAGMGLVLGFGFATRPTSAQTMSTTPSKQPSAPGKQAPQSLTVARIEGALVYQPHSLVKLSAANVDSKSALHWRISPNRHVQRATSARHLLEFASPPGDYEVTLLVISSTSDGLSVDEANVMVRVEGCDHTPPVSPPQKEPETTPPPKKESERVDPLNAISKIQFGNSGCTACPIFPRRPDGRWDVLTAAHCIPSQGVGARGTLVTRDGQTRLGVRCVAINRSVDLAWLETDESADLSCAKLASTNPAVTVKVWHAGNGVDRPGNREDGEVEAEEDAQGKLRFLLSVSSGDSGGPIFRDDSGEIVGAVCCTMQRGAKVSMWAGSVLQAAKLRPKLGANDGRSWAPVPLPIAPNALTIKSESWKPIDMPVVTHR